MTKNPFACLPLCVGSTLLMAMPPKPALPPKHPGSPAGVSPVAVSPADSAPGGGRRQGFSPAALARVREAREAREAGEQLPALRTSPPSSSRQFGPRSPESMSSPQRSRLAETLAAGRSESQAPASPGGPSSGGAGRGRSPVLLSLGGSGGLGPALRQPMSSAPDRGGRPSLPSLPLGLPMLEEAVTDTVPLLLLGEGDPASTSLAGVRLATPEPSALRLDTPRSDPALEAAITSRSAVSPDSGSISSGAGTARSMASVAPDSARSMASRPGGPTPRGLRGMRRGSSASSSAGEPDGQYDPWHHSISALSFSGAAARSEGAGSATVAFRSGPEAVLLTLDDADPEDKAPARVLPADGLGTTWVLVPHLANSCLLEANTSVLLVADASATKAKTIRVRSTPGGKEICRLALPAPVQLGEASESDLRVVLEDSPDAEAPSS